MFRPVKLETFFQKTTDLPDWWRESGYQASLSTDTVPKNNSWYRNTEVFVLHGNFTKKYATLAKTPSSIVWMKILTHMIQNICHLVIIDLCHNTTYPKAKQNTLQILFLVCLNTSQNFISSLSIQLFFNPLLVTVNLHLTREGSSEPFRVPCVP